MDEAAALPITGGCVVRPARSVLWPPSTPCWLFAPFPLRVIGRHAPTSSAAVGPARASTVPVVTFRTFRALYVGEFFAVVIQGLHRFHGLRPEGRGSALPFPACAGTFTARQASLNASDRSVAPPIGLLTLGFGLARFQTKPPACYWAPWRLPRPDLHRLAATSFKPGQITSCRSLPVPVRTPVRRGI
jgi:hypothetical protein